METYRLSSKLIEINREFLIKTSNDVKVNSVISTVYVNGEETETAKCPHPVEFSPEEILTLVKSKHSEKKAEVEVMLKCYNETMESGESERMFQLGTAFFYKKYSRESRELFNSAIALNPQFHQACNYLGMVELEMGDLNKAVEVSEKAVSMKPGFADYRFNLGHAYLAIKNCPKAVREFEEAISTNLYYADAYISLALAYLLNAIEQQNITLFQNVLTKTIDAVKKASIIDPFFDNEIHKDGLIAIEALDVEVAFAMFSKLLKNKKEKRDIELSDYYVKYLYSSDANDDKTLSHRINYLKEEIEKYPTYADLHDEISSCYLSLARNYWQNSLNHLQKALDINPSLDNINNLLEEAGKEIENINRVISGKSKI